MSDAPKFKSFADTQAGSFRALRSISPLTDSKPTALQDKSSVDKYGQDKIGKDKSGMDKTRQDKTRQVETSPTKNYTKTSNSIVKTAIPEKYFRGQSKHTYDVLYLRTRGAIVPVRQVQLSKTELVKLTGLAEKTVQLHIRYLRDAGLINVHPQMGSRSGWIYEVFVPEEVGELAEYGQDRISMDKTGMDKTGRDKTSQNLSSQTMQNLSILDHTNRLENKELSSTSKTSFKDNVKNDDDSPRVSEAFSILEERLDAAARKITGKGVSKSEAEKWGTLADLLVLELEIAASRADGISSIPAFLTEILRRQFFTARQQRSSAKVSKTFVKADTVGKSEAETFEIKALDEKGREAALVQLQEFASDDFLKDFKKWYTPEDWSWLIVEIKKLEKNEK